MIYQSEPFYLNLMVSLESFSVLSKSDLDLNRTWSVRHWWTCSDPFSMLSGLGVESARWSPILYTRLCCLRSRSSVSAGRIGTPWPGARGHATLSGDSLVGPVVFLGRRGSPYSWVSWVCRGACSLSCFFLISLIWFVKGSPYHLVSVRPCGFIYKVKWKTALRKAQPRMHG